MIVQQAYEAAKAKLAEERGKRLKLRDENAELMRVIAGPAQITAKNARIENVVSPADKAPKSAKGNLGDSGWL